MISPVTLPHPIVVLRHPKERKSKCTMQPMHSVPGFFFHNASPSLRYDGTGHLLLALGAPLLTVDDGSWQPGERDEVEALRESRANPPAGAVYHDFPRRPILLLDATWRRLPAVARCVVGAPIRRSLPEGVRTAYPRVNATGRDPAGGLATIEALYVALRQLGCPDTGVLQGYHWKDAFLTQF